MPISSGAVGRAFVLGVPALRRSSGLDGVGVGGANNGGPRGSGVLKSGWRPSQFRSPPFNAIGKFVTGVTRNSAGVALPGVMVDLYDSRTDQKVDSQTSDGSGNYSFGVANGPYYIVAYLAGSPDVAGTTVNTLTGV